MKYTILQLDDHNPDVVKDRKLFEPWNILNRHSKFDISQYKKVYEGEIQEEKNLLRTLESIFEKFNLHHPSDFYGHSLSVSDEKGNAIYDFINVLCADFPILDRDNLLQRYSHLI